MIGGIFMPKNREKDTYVIILLGLILVGIVIGTIYSLIHYYTSPDYIVNSYVSNLMSRDYKSIYHLLEKSSTNEVGNKAEIKAYYKKVYEKQNQLIGVKVISCKGENYEVQYTYPNGTKTENLQVVREKSKWRVRFPFDICKLEVFGAADCKVYLDGVPLLDMGEGRYIEEKVLPGMYMLQVKFPLAQYKDYYKMISLPEEGRFILPYETGAIKVYTAPGFEVSIGKSKKRSNKDQLLFSEMLLGDYELKVEDPKGYMKSQNTSFTLEKGLTSLKLQDYELTETGIKSANDFMKSFYEAYEKGINEHQAGEIAPYLNKQYASAIEAEYNSWFIDKKKIDHADFQVEYGEKFVDQSAKLHQYVTEKVILYNREEDDEGQMVIKAYRLQLTWEMVMSSLQNDWQIEDRLMIESMVAVQDSEGRWVQY